MTYNQGGEKFYKRHWDAAFNGESNIDGSKVVLSDFHYLDSNDAFFISAPAGTFDAVKGAINGFK
ncbi:MAG TPA: hypothetical protein VHM90_15600 [Phycisphaerae bacterium]|nr:hypothetical protein [Phycisphaerae bacterium]